jgi:hypothetical protein
MAASKKCGLKAAHHLGDSPHFEGSCATHHTGGQQKSLERGWNQKFLRTSKHDYRNGHRLPSLKVRSSRGRSRKKAGRPPPIVLTYAVNLIQLQKQIKGLAKQSFEFRSTRNGTRVIIRDMVDYLAVKSLSHTNNLSYFTFHRKSMKPSSEHPSRRHTDRLVDLGFDVINAKQMSSTRRFPAEAPKTLPLHLITLPKTAQFQ